MRSLFSVPQGTSPPESVLDRSYKVCKVPHHFIRRKVVNNRRFDTAASHLILVRKARRRRVIAHLGPGPTAACPLAKADEASQAGSCLWTADIGRPAPGSPVEIGRQIEVIPAIAGVMPGCIGVPGLPVCTPSLQDARLGRPVGAVLLWGAARSGVLAVRAKCNATEPGRTRGSIRLGVSGFNHPGPLLGECRNEVA